jgi:hypothetical protein
MPSVTKVNGDPLVRRPVGEDEARQPARRVAVPGLGEVEHPPADEERSGVRHPVEDLAVGRISAGDPLVQDVTALAQGLVRPVRRAGDEPVE